MMVMNIAKINDLNELLDNFQKDNSSSCPSKELKLTHILISKKDIGTNLIVGELADIDCLRESKNEKNLSRIEGNFMNTFLDAKTLYVKEFTKEANKIIKDLTTITEKNQSHQQNMDTLITLNFNVKQISEKHMTKLLDLKLFDKLN